MRHLVNDHVFDEVLWLLHEFRVQTDMPRLMIAASPLGLHLLSSLLALALAWPNQSLAPASPSLPHLWGIGKSSQGWSPDYRRAQWPRACRGAWPGHHQRGSSSPTV